jgi:hypothetical protein
MGRPAPILAASGICKHDLSRTKDRAQKAAANYQEFFLAGSFRGLGPQFGADTSPFALLHGTQSRPKRCHHARLSFACGFVRNTE